MKVRDLDSLQEMIQRWDGEIVVDTYDFQGSSGFTILSLIKDNRVAHSIRFEGDKSQIIILFTDILRKNVHKIVKEQRNTVKGFRDD